MKKQHRFVVAALALLGVVGYLMVTGMRDSMIYYYTPDELLAKTAADATVHDVGVKVGGRVVPGSVRFDQRTLDLRFEVTDIQTGKGRFPVHYQGPLPDTFEEGRDVVVEGRYTQAGLFEATTVLTKCGSRYEAVEEDFRA
ncbi:MAG: cytochrome c maturation protein CcmE [Gemmatimonadota bacterium]|nr:cytochrome c maturation protein CcmE [Gemmatimonadota bacterium]